MGILDDGLGILFGRRVVYRYGDGGVWVTIPGSCFFDDGGKKKIRRL